MKVLLLLLASLPLYAQGGCLGCASGGGSSTPAQLTVNPPESDLDPSIQGDTTPGQLEVFTTDGSFTASISVERSGSTGNIYGIAGGVSLTGGSGYVNTLFLNPILTGTASGQAYGLESQPQVEGTSVDAVYGAWMIPTFGSAGGGGSAGNIYFTRSEIYKDASSDLSSSTIWGHYVSALSANGAANAYYSWFDSRGVRRVKEDATFDSVYQAIDALYNPQFTKYTPGAANYERVVLGQWNGNVAEIGTEKGGTGTFRNLRLIGNAILVPSLTTTGAASGKKVVCVDTSTGQLYASSTGTDCSN